MTTRTGQRNLRNIVIITLLILSIVQNIIYYTKVNELQEQLETRTLIINGYSSTITSLEIENEELNNQIETLWDYSEYLEEELSNYRSKLID